MIPKEKVDRIMFREFKGENNYIFSVKEKKDKMILKYKWNKNVYLSYELFKQLEQLGEIINLKYEDITYGTLFVFIIADSYLTDKLIQEVEGKFILNIDMCLDKEIVYERMYLEMKQNSEIVYKMVKGETKLKDKNYDFSKHYPNLAVEDRYELLQGIEHLTEEKYNERMIELTRRLREHENLFNEKGTLEVIEECECCGTLKLTGIITYQRCNECGNKFGKRGHKKGCTKDWIPPYTYTGPKPATYETLHCGNCINHDGVGGCDELNTNKTNCPRIWRKR